MLGDDALGNGYYTVVLATVGNVHNLEGIGGVKSNVLAIRINLIPLICIGSGGGAANNLNDGFVAVVGLINVAAYGNGEFLVNDCV